ncbi:hypothetical protein ACZ90_12500 [Streptomyces albus subsp. albus]|nr:hypothetical protein ACZ90_12500 [Streptomyces albus subsp. albus]
MIPQANPADTLAAHAARRGREPAVIDIGPDGSSRWISYAELDLRARGVAERLYAHQAAGRRVLVAMDCGAHAAAALFGCLYAGAVAVPVPAPDGSGVAAERTAAVAKDAAVQLVLTEAAHATETSRQLSPTGGPRPVCLAVDGPLPAVRPPDTAAGRGARPYQARGTGSAEHARAGLGGVRQTGPGRGADARPGGGPSTRRPARIGRDDLALLAYDSGSAAAPRGARLTHGNLRAALYTVHQALGADRGSRIGGWLPRQHTLGLVGQLLYPLLLGATAVSLPRGLDPVQWLYAVGRHRITELLAPDSRFAECAARAGDVPADLDLSRLRTAVDAGEPVSTATLNAFRRGYGPAGLLPGALVPGYVPPEAAPWLVVADRDPGRAAEVCVVDPRSRQPVPEGAPGEIWLRGPAVADGHWNGTRVAGEHFAARTADGRGGYLRTGDLGVARDDRPRLLGRLHETLLVDGVTLHPRDVERELLRCGRTLGTARVFCTGPGAGPLIVVQEVLSAGGSRAGLPELARRVRERVAAEFGATVAGVLLVRAGTLRRPGTGKVAGRLLREQFLRGEVRALHAEYVPGLRVPAARAVRAGSPGNGVRRNPPGPIGAVPECDAYT